MATGTENGIGYDSDGEIALKLSLYMTLKNLYDKWFSTYSESRFKLKTPDEEKEEYNSKILGEDWDRSKSEFSSFVYVDSFYNDISNKMLLNPEDILNIVKDHRDANSNYSVYQVFNEICTKNKLLFITLPVYNNYYDASSLANVFMPQPDKTMKISDGSTYICMYTHQLSHILNNNMDNDEKYRQDGFDIADVNGKVSQESCNSLFKSHINGENGFSDIKVPAFGVTYARQNQSYFTNITVNMDSPKLTDFSIQNQFRLAKVATGNNSEANRTIEPRSIAQDAYSIFANQSYTCSVEMLGCMNIMPMMYFQLNNIPMFRGAYMITNVEHSISAGNMRTKFVGVRVSKIQIPYNKTAFSLAPYMEKFMNMATLEKCDINGDYYDLDVKVVEINDVNMSKEGRPIYKYFDVNKVCADTTKWRIPLLSEETGNKDDDKTDANQNTNSVKSEFSELLWPKGRTYNVSSGSEERGFTKYGPILWIKKGYTETKFKNYMTFGSMKALFDNPKWYGFQLVYTASTLDEANYTSGKEWWAGDIAKMRLKHKYNGSDSIWFHAMWDGKQWVSDHYQGDKVCDIDDKYKLWDNELVRVYRFSDDAYENCNMRKAIVEKEEELSNKEKNNDETLTES